MGVNIDEILQSLEQEKTAEANFAEGLSNENSTPESTENQEVASETPAEETSAPEATLSDEEANEKIAAECDAQGRIMARAFVGELNKLAADAEPNEEVSETSEPVSNEETVQAEETNSSEEKVASEDASSAEHIVGSLYNNFFGEDE